MIGVEIIAWTVNKKIDLDIHCDIPQIHVMKLVFNLIHQCSFCNHSESPYYVFISQNLTQTLPPP